MICTGNAMCLSGLLRHLYSRTVFTGFGKLFKPGWLLPLFNIYYDSENQQTYRLIVGLQDDTYVNESKRI